MNTTVTALAKEIATVEFQLSEHQLFIEDENEEGIVLPDGGGMGFAENNRNNKSRKQLEDKIKKNKTRCHQWRIKKISF